jgi:hypothetical protein
MNIPQDIGLMNTHGQTVDPRGRLHVVMGHCTAESLKAVGSKPGEEPFGPVTARRYHHYWRDERGRWAHTELPGIAGSRPKIFVDEDSNAYVVFGSRIGNLLIMAASATSHWTDWEVVHTEKGPFGGEMLGDAYRWQTRGILSIMVQGAPRRAHEATPLRILDYSLKQE